MHNIQLYTTEFTNYTFGESRSMQEMYRCAESEDENVPVPELDDSQLGIVSHFHPPENSVESKIFQLGKRLAETKLNFKAPKMRRTVEDDNMGLCVDQLQDGHDIVVRNDNGDLLSNPTEFLSGRGTVPNNELRNSLGEKIPLVCTEIWASVQQSSTTVIHATHTPKNMNLFPKIDVVGNTKSEVSLGRYNCHEVGSTSRFLAKEYDFSSTSRLNESCASSLMPSSSSLFDSSLSRRNASIPEQATGHCQVIHSQPFPPKPKIFQASSVHSSRTLLLSDLPPYHAMHLPHPKIEQHFFPFLATIFPSSMPVQHNFSQATEAHSSQWPTPVHPSRKLNFRKKKTGSNCCATNKGRAKIAQECQTIQDIFTDLRLTENNLPALGNMQEETRVNKSQCTNPKEPDRSDEKADDQLLIRHTVENHGTTLADIQLFWTKYYEGKLPCIHFTPTFQIFEGGVKIVSNGGGPITEPLWIELPPFYKITCLVEANLKEKTFFHLMRKHVGIVTPIGYSSTNRLAEFYLDCSSKTYQLHCKKKCLEKDKIQVRRIEPLFSIVPVLSEDFKKMLARTILSSWTIIDKTLDLGEFHRKSDLITTHCCPIYDVEVFKFIVQYINIHLRQLNKLKLNGNKIRSLEFLKLAVGTRIAMVNELDLSRNEIREYSELSHVQSFFVTDLYLQQNRLVSVDFEEYASSVRRYLPHLQKLDSVGINEHKIVINEETDLARQRRKEQERARSLIKEVLKPFLSVEKQNASECEGKDVEGIELEDRMDDEESEFLILGHYNFLNPKVKPPLVDLVDENGSDNDIKVVGGTSTLQRKGFVVKKNEIKIEETDKAWTKNLVLPRSQQMFFVTDDPEAIKFVTKFVQMYVEVYDSGKRNRLVNWYTQLALFSLTSVICQGASSYDNNDRNLMAFCWEKRWKKVYVGNEKIVAALSNFPLHTKHFSTSFSIDLLYYTGNAYLVSFCGIFEERRKAIKLQRSFKRVFLIVQDGSECRICNDELFLADATSEQSTSQMLMEHHSRVKIKGKWCQ